jgi:hypothetical protein
LTKENKLSEVDIVIYSLYQLGGWQERIHTEDIALRCFQTAPSKFSWIKYKQYPDLMTAWYALGRAKKGRYGGLVIGGSERKKGTGKDKFGGWRLNEKGLQWIEDNRYRIEEALFGGMSPDDRLIEARRLKTLIKSQAYKKHVSQGEKAEISHAEFAESLICTVNTKPEMLRERLEQLYSAAEVLKQIEVKQYLDYCRNRFNKQITCG